MKPDKMRVLWAAVATGVSGLLLIGVMLALLAFDRSTTSGTPDAGMWIVSALGFLLGLFNVFVAKAFLRLAKHEQRTNEHRAHMDGGRVHA